MLADLVVSGGISDTDLQEFLFRELSRIPLEGLDVLVIVPDNTRTLPMPTLLTCLDSALSSRANKLTYLVAGGTHSHMTVRRAPAPSWPAAETMLIPWAKKMTPTTPHTAKMATFMSLKN